MVPAPTSGARGDWLRVAVVEDRVRPTVVDDAAVLHPHDALGGVGDRLVVGDEQDRLAAGVQAAEQLEHLFAALAVERAGRLVGEQSVGSLASARAIASRWRWPPDSTPGACLALSPMPSRSSRSRARVSAALRLRPAISAGITTFSSTRHALEQVEELEDDADVACGA